MKSQKHFNLYILTFCLLMVFAAVLIHTNGKHTADLSTVYAEPSPEEVAESATEESMETAETELQPVLLDTDEVSTADILMYGSAAVVMDADTGQVLYFKNPFNKLYPASLTKMLTALVVLDNTELSDTLTISQYALDNITYDSSSLWLLPGQTLTMEEALYGLMLSSANEISNAMAEHVGGSIEGFADMMNTYADQLGCFHTHFTNPSGLHDDDHYTSAYDLAMIGKAGLNNAEFTQIVSTAKYTFTSKILKEETESVEGETEADEPLVISNHHRFLNGVLTYDGAYGGKTGYTHPARNTLATFATRNDHRLVCIILDAPGGKNYSYIDTQVALDYCFDNYDRLATETTLYSYEPIENPRFPIPTVDNPHVFTPLLYDAANADLDNAFADATTLEIAETSGPDLQPYIIGIAIIAFGLMFIALCIVLLIRGKKRHKRK